MAASHELSFARRILVPLLAMGVGTGAVSARHARASASPDSAIARDVQSILAANAVHVHLGWTEWAPVAFRSKLPSHYIRQVTVGNRDLGAEYVKRFLEVLDLAKRPPANASQRLTGCPADDDRSKADLWVAFVGVGETTSTRIIPEAGIVTFGRERRYDGSLFLGDRVEGMRKLIAEVFPDSPIPAQVKWCDRLVADTSEYRPGAATAPPKEVLPEAKTRVPPDYPEEARRANVSGTVIVQALVGEDGVPKETAIRSSIPMLDASAVRCVEQWRFSPATADGKPRAVWVSIPVKFTLH